MNSIEETKITVSMERSVSDVVRLAVAMDNLIESFGLMSDDTIAVLKFHLNIREGQPK